jgi:hypothetical protein
MILKAKAVILAHGLLGWWIPGCAVASAGRRFRPSTLPLDTAWGRERFDWTHRHEPVEWPIERLDPAYRVLFLSAPKDESLNHLQPA